MKGKALQKELEKRTKQHSDGIHRLFRLPIQESTEKQIVSLDMAGQVLAFCSEIEKLMVDSILVSSEQASDEMADVSDALSTVKSVITRWVRDCEEFIFLPN
jgi:hypothetical protein